MIQPQNIGRFDIKIDVLAPTNDDTGGFRNTTYANLYTDVRAREVKPQGVKGFGDEKMENDQVVASQKKAFVVHKYNRVFTNYQKVSYDGVLFWVRNIRPYGFDRRFTVLEVEQRDND